MHLLNLKQSTGEAATDAAQLHREIARRPEGKGRGWTRPPCRVSTRAQFADASHLSAIRTVLDRAHHHAVDPRFWRPRWLKTRQGGLGMLLLANVFWGLSFPLIKTITQLNARLLPAAGGAVRPACALAPRFLLGLLLLLLPL